MEEVIEILKEKFQNKDYTRDNKIAFAIGYLEECEKVNRKEAIQIMSEIFFNRL